MFIYSQVVSAMILNELALVLAIALSSQTVLADEKLRGRLDNVSILSITVS